MVILRSVYVSFLVTKEIRLPIMLPVGKCLHVHVPNIITKILTNRRGDPYKKKRETKEVKVMICKDMDAYFFFLFSGGRPKSQGIQVRLEVGTDKKASSSSNLQGGIHSGCHLHVILARFSCDS